MADVYPASASWREELIASLPHAWNGGAAFASVVAMLQEARNIDVTIEDVARGFADVEHASHGVLAFMGRVFDQPREGLAWHEYRRIIAGARIVSVRRGGSFTRDDLWALWLALTGSDGDGASFTTPSTTTPGIRMVARITWSPSAAYKRRAGVLVGRALPPAMPYNAIVYQPGSLRLNGLPSFGGHLAHTLYEDRTYAAP